MSSSAVLNGDIERAYAEQAARWYACARYLASRLVFNVCACPEDPAPTGLRRPNWLKALRALLRRAAARGSVIAHSALWALDQADVALWRIVEKWTPKARGLVRRSLRHESEIIRDDVNQQVVLSLYDAAVRFDPNKGPFPAFASGYLKLGLSSPEARSGAVQIPAHRRWVAIHLSRGRTPEEVAEMTDVSLATVERVQGAGRVDSPSVRDWESSEALGMQHEPDLSSRIDRLTEAQIVRDEIDRLDSPDAAVLCLFHGIEHPRYNATGTVHTYVQIAVARGCGAKWVGALLTRARKTLRKRLAMRLGARHAMDGYARGEEWTEAQSEWARAAVVALERGDVPDWQRRDVVRALFALGVPVPLGRRGAGMGAEVGGMDGVGDGGAHGAHGAHGAQGV